MIASAAALSYERKDRKMYFPLFMDQNMNDEKMKHCQTKKVLKKVWSPLDFTSGYTRKIHFMAFFSIRSSNSFSEFKGIFCVCVSVFVLLFSIILSWVWFYLLILFVNFSLFFFWFTWKKYLWKWWKKYWVNIISGGIHYT